MATIAITVDGSPVGALRRTSLKKRRPSSELTLRIYDPDLSTTVDFDDEVVYSVDGSTQFTGIIRRKRILQGDVSRDGSARMLEFTAYDYAWRCAHPATLIEADYESTSDRTIIQELVTLAGLGSEITAPNATVAELDTAVTISFGPDATLAECLNKLSEYTGAVWYVDEQKRIVYNTRAAMNAHDWSIDQENPNNSTLQRVAIDELDQVWSQPASNVTVFGSDDTYGEPLEGSASTVLPKTYAHVIVDRKLAVQEQVDAVAQKAVDTLSVAPKKIKFRYHYGAPGADDIPSPLETVDVTSAVHGLSAEEFTIEQVEVETTRTDDPIIIVTCSTNGQLGIKDLIKKLRARETRPKVLFAGYDFVAADEEFVRAPSVAAIDSLAAMTFGCWIKLDAISGSQTIAYKDNFSSGGWRFRVESTGRLFLFVDYSISDANVNGSLVLEAGKVYHVGFTVENVTAKIFINGEQDASNTGSGSKVADAGVPIDIGYNDGADAGGDSSRPLDGMIAGIRIWDAALPPNLIRRIASKPGAEPDLWSGDLVAYWRMDEFGPGEVTSAGNMRDSSTSGNHGGPVGAATQFPHGREALA